MTRQYPHSSPGTGHDPENPKDELHSDDAGIEDLLREVGARAEPSALLTDEVRSAVHAEWRAIVEARRRRLRGLTFAMAACVGVVAATVIGLRIGQTGPVPVATIVRIEGSVQVGTLNQLHAGQAGEVLSSGMQLTTGTDARVALSIADPGTSGISLRVDAGSQLRFLQQDQLELQAGALYVDTDTAGTYPLVVQTAAGAVRHLGTQYQVRTVGGSEVRGIEVSIREGRVEIASDYGTNTGVAGERLAVSKQGTVLRSALPPYDSSWQWATRVAPPFDIAGRSLSSFIEWVARETGREVSYESVGGSIAGLDPATALQAVLKGTNFKMGQTPLTRGDQAIRIALED